MDGCNDAHAAATTGAGSGGYALHFDCVADLGEPAASARPGGYAPANRSTIKFGKQRLVLAEGIGFVANVFQLEAPALEESVKPEAVGLARTIVGSPSRSVKAEGGIQRIISCPSLKRTLRLCRPLSHSVSRASPAGL